MSESRRLLPPMGALNVFASAARHASFSRAGLDVGLTQSAVSRQIAVLEDWVQVRLFERVGRGVELTSDGRAYAEVVGDALNRIKGATGHLLDRRPETELNIATLPGFGMRWLVPRLPKFTALHPSYVVNFAARSLRFDFVNQPFDATVHFGAPDWPDVNHDFLFREVAIPVCSPAWLAQNPLTSADDLLKKTLLFHSLRPAHWQAWFEANEVDCSRLSHGPAFEQFPLLAQAAVAGSGVALMPRFLIETELASGALVPAIDLPFVTEGAYYLLWPARAKMRPALVAFRNWIVSEASESFGVRGAQSAR
jgi:LysR family glycine cleavage system transcriptional activator